VLFRSVATWAKAFVEHFAPLTAVERGDFAIAADCIAGFTATVKTAVIGVATLAAGEIFAEVLALPKSTRTAASRATLHDRRPRCRSDTFKT